MDRRFQMMFSITADYVMLKGIRGINIPKEMRQKIMTIVCEHLQMGTVSHLVGIPSLARFFEQRYNQLKNRIPVPKMKIRRNVFERLGYDLSLIPLKHLEKNIFDNMFDYVINDVRVVYEEFRKNIVNLN